MRWECVKLPSIWCLCASIFFLKVLEIGFANVYVFHFLLAQLLEKCDICCSFCILFDQFESLVVFSNQKSGYLLCRLVQLFSLFCISKFWIDLISHRSSYLRFNGKWNRIELIRIKAIFIEWSATYSEVEVNWNSLFVLPAVKFSITSTKFKLFDENGRCYFSILVVCIYEQTDCG